MAYHVVDGGNSVSRRVCKRHFNPTLIEFRAVQPRGGNPFGVVENPDVPEPVLKFLQNDSRPVIAHSICNQDLHLKIAELLAQHPQAFDIRRVNKRAGARQDVVEAAWAIVDPVIHGPSPMFEYEPGTWGPDEAQELIGSDGPWIDPTEPKESK